MSTEKPYILFVDDNPKNLQVLGNLLMRDFMTAFATNGPEALKSIEKKQPDLILLDIMMPEMDGFEVCKRLKADPKTSDVPVIFLSARTETEDIVQGLKLGAADYVTKPFCRPELLARVHTHLQIRRYQNHMEEVVRERTEALQKIEKQLRQSQKMEAIGTLAGGIAHDFNNILCSILGFTELGISDIDPGDPVADYLEAIWKSGKRAHELVAQILAFSRAEEQAVSPVRVDLILKEALKLLRPAIPSNIEILQHIDMEFTILGDSTRIHQVIMNLCANAYQAMYADGGTLNISLTPVILEDEAAAILLLKPGGYVKLTVSDTGPGIPPENQARIFDPYFTTKEKGKGTGLGLSVVHGIVKSHGGAITIKSKTGAGAEFEVYLPASAANDNNKQEKPVSRLPGGNEHILLVDDEKDIVTIAKKMLERLGYRVTASEKANETLSIFTDSPEEFDLVISDMTMPKMTGVRLAEKLKAINNGIKIIICSGNNEAITREGPNEPDVDGYMEKPMTMRRLAETVRNILDGKKG